MLQAVMEGPYKVRLCDAAVPDIQKDEVLLRVTRVGICGSDMQMYHGKHKYATFPVIIGHEACGIIAQVGGEVRGFAPGEAVAVQPQLVCGACYPCSIGRMNVCANLKVMGVHEDGFAAEFVAVKPSMLHRCPENMPADLAILAEPMAVAVGAVRRSRYRDANIAVIGAGIIGNLIAQAAQALSGRPVLIADIQDSRLALARECGIGYTVNTKQTGLKAAVEASFGNRKADVIIDAAATTGSFADALAASRPASEIVITGNYKEEIALEVPLLQRREVNLIGHMMYTREDFALAIDDLASGKIKSNALITGRYAMQEIVDAFAYVDQNPAEVMKAIVEISN